MIVLRRFLSLVALVLVSGCNSGYYLHLYQGHMALMDARRPIDELVAAEGTDAQLKQRLQLVLAVRAYAAAELGLPVDSEGIVVLDPGPFGAQVGLQTGDRMLGVNGRRIEAPRDVDRLLRRPGPLVQIEVLRGNRRLLLRFRA